MKTLFDLSSGREIGDQHTLLLEAGSNYCCRGYWHKGENKLDALVYSSFDETETDVRLREIVTALKAQNLKQAIVCSGFSQALLVPTRFFSQEYSLLDALYGCHRQAHFHDGVPEWQLTNVYAVPAPFEEAVQRSFSMVQFFHAYTPALKIYNGYVADHQLMVHFTTGHFRVLFKKDSALQLAQTYAYSTPLDVVYYLLKIGYEAGLAQADVHLILSGLIEKESSLFEQLQQYFSNVHFAHPPEMALPDASLPHHFFTSLYNLALCAS